jgi:cell division protein FtsZ
VRAPEPAPEPIWPAVATRAPEPAPKPEPIWEEAAPVAARAEPAPQPEERAAARDAFVESLRPAATQPARAETPPLFAEPRYEEKKKGGFLSLFGGKSRQPYQDPEPAYRAPVAPAGPTRGNTALQPTQAQAEEPQADADDLDIPSFLRRLAN